jgi:hypothetical protein
MGLKAGFWQKLMPVFLAPAVTILVATGDELEWESPAGRFVMGPDGKNSLPDTIPLFQRVNLLQPYLSGSRLVREQKSSDCLTDKEIEHGF